MSGSRGRKKDLNTNTGHTDTDDDDSDNGLVHSVSRRRLQEARKRKRGSGEDTASALEQRKTDLARHKHKENGRRNRKKQQQSRGKGPEETLTSLSGDEEDNDEDEEEAVTRGTRRTTRLRTHTTSNSKGNGRRTTMDPAEVADRGSGSNKRAEDDSSSGSSEEEIAPPTTRKSRKTPRTAPGRPAKPMSAMNSHSSGHGSQSDEDEDESGSSESESDDLPQTRASTRSQRNLHYSTRGQRRIQNEQSSTQSKGFFDSDIEITEAPVTRTTRAMAENKRRANSRRNKPSEAKSQQTKTKESKSNEESDSSDDVCCTLCGSPDATTANDIVLCDVCEEGFHQKCYGLPLAHEVPVGSWMCSSCFELLPEASSQKQHEKRRQDTELACVRDSIDFASAWKVLWALRGVLNLDDVTIPSLEEGIVNVVSSRLCSEVHAALLKGLGRYTVNTMTWPKVLQDLCNNEFWKNEFDEAWKSGLGYVSEERKAELLEDEDNQCFTDEDVKDNWNYFEQSVSVRLILIRILCDLQLVYNDKVARIINQKVEEQTSPAGDPKLLQSSQPPEDLCTYLLKDLEDFNFEDFKCKPIYTDSNGWKYILLCDSLMHARLCRWSSAAPRYSVPRNPRLRGMKPQRRIHSPRYDSASSEFSRSFHLGYDTNGESAEIPSSKNNDNDIVDLVSPGEPENSEGDSSTSLYKLLKERTSTSHRYKKQNSLLAWLRKSSEHHEQSLVSTEGANMLVSSSWKVNDSFADKCIQPPPSYLPDNDPLFGGERDKSQDPLERWCSPLSSATSKRARPNWGFCRFESLCLTINEIRALQEMMVNVDHGEAPLNLEKTQEPLQKWGLSKDRQTAVNNTYDTLVSPNNLGTHPMDWHCLTSSIGKYIAAMDDIESRQKSKQRKLEKLQNTLGDTSLDLSIFAYDGDTDGSATRRLRGAKSEVTFQERVDGEGALGTASDNDSDDGKVEEVKKEASNDDWKNSGSSNDVTSVTSSSGNEGTEDSKAEDDYKEEDGTIVID